MRGLCIGRVAGGGGRALARKNAFALRAATVGSKLSIPKALIRQYSSSNEPASSSQWTPHSLRSASASATVDTPSALSTTATDEGKMHRAYIALGSNLGDRIGWIEKACNAMAAQGIKIKRTSCLWETDPMYVLDQASFINGACEVDTTLGPLALLDVLQGIENDLGREKVVDKGPRNIDLDILLYDEEEIDHERLKVPHPLMFEREFVLRPLAELIPGTALNPASPWKITQDYLNALPASKTPMSTLTPLSPAVEPLRALQPNRQTLVMAIMNTTPDSFSDGGVNILRGGESSRLQAAKQFAITVSKAIEYGAKIIDVGGQTTKPKAVETTPTEEMSRIAPAIEIIASLYAKPKVAISIDTYRASVAKLAVEHGADIINDVSAGQMDPEMLPTMARLGKTVCLMHMRGTPTTMKDLVDYPDGLIPTIATELLARVAEAEAAGIRRWRIILDPGIGFAKTHDQNIEILRRLDELREWPGLKGLPWLVGSSRKKFIGTVTGVKKAEKRTWGTGATVAAAVQGGADVVRVHDVWEMGQVVKMSDAIWRV